jgi:hypothetical protein
MSASPGGLGLIGHALKMKMLHDAKRRPSDYSTHSVPEDSAWQAPSPQEQSDHAFLMQRRVRLGGMGRGGWIAGVDFF